MSHPKTSDSAQLSTTATLPRVAEADSPAPDGATTEPEKVKLDLSLTGVVGSSLAAITAAYLGSRLGVAGTIIGAGLGSVVSAVAAALYTASLRQSRSGLRTAMAQLRPGSDGAPSTADRHTTNNSRLGAFAARLRPHWKKIVGAAAAIFVIAIAAITTYESVAGSSLSGTPGDTSVSRVFGADDTRTSPPPEPAPRDEQRTAPDTGVKPVPNGESTPAPQTDPNTPANPSTPSGSAEPTTAAPDKPTTPTSEPPAPTTAAPGTATPTAPTADPGSQGGATQKDPAAP